MKALVMEQAGSARDFKAREAANPSMGEDEAAARHITTSSLTHRMDKAQLSLLADLVAEHKIRVVVDQIFPFTPEGVAAAYGLSDSGHAVGKILIKVK